MKRFLCLLLVLAGSLSVVSCSDDPAIPDISLKLTRVVFEKAKNPALAADIEASINHGDRSVLARLNAGELSSLEPTLYAVGAASYEPVGKQDFTTPVFYTIISTDTFSSLGYMVTVLPGGDAYDVTASRQWLEVGYATGESSTAVSNNVTLVNLSTNGCTISWASDSTNVVVTGTTGTVYRPSHTAGNLGVTLTATITKGSASTTKTFVLTVIKLPPSDAESVAADKTALVITYASGDSAASITQNVTLATSGSWGSTISWAQTIGTAIAVNGTVTRPSYTDGDATVTLTATIQKGAVSDTKVFSALIVKKLPPTTDAEKVLTDKENLVIEYQAGDSATSVTKALTLATAGTNAGVTISWATTDTGVIATDGTVTRPAIGQPDASVTLTATITSGGESDTKTFELTVKALRPTITIVET
ncbi:MAG TPA: hypothetical protein PLM00_06940, partial [Spirochaetota bacterium]|nr:hypothetical protein [Spirochaetota bacterium]